MSVDLEVFMDELETLLRKIAETCDEGRADEAQLMLNIRRQVRDFCNEWGIDWKDPTGREN